MKRTINNLLCRLGFHQFNLKASTSPKHTVCLRSDYCRGRSYDLTGEWAG